jgi:hypothetical protein
MRGRAGTVSYLWAGVLLFAALAVLLNGSLAAFLLLLGGALFLAWWGRRRNRLDH